MSYLTDERRMIQQTAREFTMTHVLPLANELDPVQGDIPMELRDKLADMGYFGIVIPEKYGGMGLGAFEYCLVTEELSRGWMSVASIIARGNGLMGEPYMTESQRERYLARMVKGEFLGAYALSEPNAGSDVANISCRARKDGDSWLITGSKYWCTLALILSGCCAFIPPRAPSFATSTAKIARSLMVTCLSSSQRVLNSTLLWR